MAKKDKYAVQVLISEEEREKAELEIIRLRKKGNDLKGKSSFFYWLFDTYIKKETIQPSHIVYYFPKLGDKLKRKVLAQIEAKGYKVNNEAIPEFALGKRLKITHLIVGKSFNIGPFFVEDKEKELLIDISGISIPSLGVSKETNIRAFVGEIL